MSLKKQYLKSKPICKVTFSVAAEVVENAGQVALVGEFNNWNLEEAIELSKLKNGSFKTTVDLPVETEYQFKYIVDGSKWINDDEADFYVSNGINDEKNSVVKL